MKMSTLDHSNARPEKAQARYAIACSPDVTSRGSLGMAGKDKASGTRPFTQGATMKRKDILLRAAYDLLTKCENGIGAGPKAGSVEIFYNGADRDGSCLREDIAIELDISKKASPLLTRAQGRVYDKERTMKDGAFAMKKIPVALTVRWIPVEESLPKDGENVIVLERGMEDDSAWKGATVQIGWLLFGGWTHRWEQAWGEDRMLDNVTHWMPFPPAKFDEEQP